MVRGSDEDRYSGVNKKHRTQLGLERKGYVNRTVDSVIRKNDKFVPSLIKKEIVKNVLSQ